jgi:V-type H+-transporting ATPase subunit C
MEGKCYWLISAPKTREDTFNTLNKKTADEHDFSVNYKFQVPDLKNFGSLDSLMALSDDLHKMDTTVENIVRKIANQLFDVLDPSQGTNLQYESLTVANSNIDAYLTFFKWDEARYPTSQSLRALTDLIVQQVGKLDEELKTKSSEYNNLLHTISAEERKIGGNMLVRDLSDVIKEEHVIETEYLETLFVAVPNANTKNFEQEYERLCEFVLPRSALKVDGDNEYELQRVVMFRKVSEEFKIRARERKYVVRDFKFTTDKSGRTDKKKLDAEKEKLRKNLIRWCKTNFSEAFIAWIHLKAIRVVVESILRYGLPQHYQAMLLLPNKNRQTRLRKALQELYGHLVSKSIFHDSKDEDEVGPDAEKFYPYISLEINLDFKNKSLY